MAQANARHAASLHGDAQKGPRAFCGRSTAPNPHWPPRATDARESELEATEVERGLADGSPVEDTRLRDALRALRSSGRLRLPLPNVVDELTHAVECAAVGEVSVVRLEEGIDELELRIAELERGLPSGVGGRLARRRTTRSPSGS
jgi:hypothetical protein